MKGESDMLKEAMKFLLDTSKPEIVDIDGRKYSNKKMEQIAEEKYPAPIKLTTLTGLMDYIAFENLQSERENELIMQVVSPTRVLLYSKLDYEQNRKQYVEVNADLPEIQFDTYLDQENFSISLKTKFVQPKDPEDDLGLLVKFAGTAESSTLRAYTDDGFSQSVTISDGVASKAQAVVPNPVKLRPYRTFLEVEQPESMFVFRMKDERGLRCALFEADGGAWKHQAVQNIKKYLSDFIAANSNENLNQCISIIA